ncbi:hypothetical protein Salat_1463900 [Sesamum alatum]|uniref:Uncharacterized protein n=1 Tax=Sesamum alatum TaxID=300844 RepID=A0AAE2CLU4_9LAMI|nr:hypothetical protein Salat_1463900 [Sesamum alatum]
MQEKPPKQKGLLYVRVLVNGKKVMAMIDTSATHNFVAEREIQKFGMSLTQHCSRIKAVNSQARPVQGVASVELTVGTWQGNHSLRVVTLDDFDLILGIDFLLLAKAMIIPNLSGFLLLIEFSPPPPPCHRSNAAANVVHRPADCYEILKRDNQIETGRRTIRREPNSSNNGVADVDKVERSLPAPPRITGGAMFTTMLISNHAAGWRMIRWDGGLALHHRWHGGDANAHHEQDRVLDSV